MPASPTLPPPEEPAPLSSAGTPLTARGRRTRAALLEAARCAFSGVEWSRTRVEDVCREAGVGHGTFYAYFANKTALLEALVVEHAGRLHALMDQPWASGAGVDPAADVARVIRGYAELTLTDRDVREAWSAAAVSEPTLAALDLAVRAEFVGRIRSTLEGARHSGFLRAGIDLAVTSVALAAMVERTVELVLLARRPGDPWLPGVDEVVSELTGLWVRAVYVEDHRPG